MVYLNLPFTKHSKILFWNRWTFTLAFIFMPWYLYLTFSKSSLWGFGFDLSLVEPIIWLWFPNYLQITFNLGCSLWSFKVIWVTVQVVHSEYIDAWVFWLWKYHSFKKLERRRGLVNAFCFQIRSKNFAFRTCITHICIYDNY